MRRWLWEHSLSIVLLALFLAILVGQVFARRLEYNADQLTHGEAAIGVLNYLGTGHFVEALFENWESEFLQMGAFIVLTRLFRQKGSPESKKLEGEEPVDADPRKATLKEETPWPVRTGGLAMRPYERSLSLAMFVLFFTTLAAHAAGGAAEYNAEQQVHGGGGVSTLGYLTTARFWFESLQNWQSEFLAIAALVVLSIYLRDRGSPESKPVAAPHSLTGS